MVGVNLATTFEHEPVTAAHATSPPSSLQPPDTVVSWLGSVYGSIPVGSGGGVVAAVGQSAFNAGSTWFVSRVSRAWLAPVAVLNAHCSPVLPSSPPDPHTLTLHPARERCSKHQSRAAVSQLGSPAHLARACASCLTRLTSSRAHCFAAAGSPHASTLSASANSSSRFCE